MPKIQGNTPMPRVDAPKTPPKTERPSSEASPAKPAAPISDRYAGTVEPSAADASPAVTDVPAQAPEAVPGASTGPGGKPSATGEPLTSELRKLARSINRVSAELARQGDPQKIEEVRTLVDGVLTHSPEVEQLLAQRRVVQEGQGEAAVADIDAQIDALIASTTDKATSAISGEHKPAKAAGDKRHKGSPHVTVPSASGMGMASSPQEKLLLNQADAAAEAAQSSLGDVKDDADIDDIIRGQKSMVDPSDPMALAYAPGMASEQFSAFTWNLIEHKSQQILELEGPLKEARQEIKQVTNELAEANEALSEAKEELKAAKAAGTDSPECKAAVTKVKAAKETVETLDAKLEKATEKCEVIEKQIQTYAKTQSILMEVFKMFIDYLMQDIYRRHFG